MLNGKLTLQTAAFNTVKTNLRVPNPANNTVTVLDGAVTARGWEASAAGYLTNEWQMIASYAYTHARITKTTIPIQLNAELQNTPTARLLAVVDLRRHARSSRSAPAPSTTARSGAICRSAAPYTVANTALVPAWWRFDLMAAYKINPKVTLAVQHLQPDGQALLRVGLHQLGGARPRAACSH